MNELTTNDTIEEDLFSPTAPDKQDNNLEDKQNILEGEIDQQTEEQEEVIAPQNEPNQE